MKHLVTKNEFINYFKNQNNLHSTHNYSNLIFDTEKQEAIKLMKQRFSVYVTPKNNRQIVTICQKPFYENQLRQLLLRYFNKLVVDLVFVLIKHNKNDSYIFKFIKKLNIKEFTCDNQNYQMSKIARNINKYTKSTDTVRMLDIGCGTGKKIKLIKRYLPDNYKIHGCDLPSWGSYTKDRHFKFPFTYIKTNPYQLQYKDGYFDCVTCLFVLHHAENLLETLIEIKRTLKPNGLLCIMEHDVWDDYKHMIIDVQHNIFKHMNDENDIYSNYYNFYEWDIIMEKIDMQPVYSQRISDSVDFKYSFDSKYICIYKKL